MKKPDFIKAKITGIYYDMPNAYYEIHMSDKREYTELPLLFIYESQIKANDIKKGMTLSIWKSVKNYYRYVAFKDLIIDLVEKREYSTKDFVLSEETQNHFDEYKKSVDERLGLKNRLNQIEQTVSAVKFINANDKKSVEQAKVTLLEHLEEEKESLKALLNPGKSR